MTTTYAIFAANRHEYMPKDSDVLRLRELLLRRRRSFDGHWPQEGSGSLADFLANREPADELMLAWIGEGLPDWRGWFLESPLADMEHLPSFTAVDLVEREKQQLPVGEADIPQFFGAYFITAVTPLSKRMFTLRFGETDAPRPSHRS